MKNITKLLCLCLIIVFAIILVACDEKSTADSGNTDNDGTPLKAIEGITLSDATYTYDGTEKSIAVSGDLPSGVSVTYTNEKATDAGTYAVSAKLSGEGYKSLTLSATLTIQKVDLIGITAEAEQSVQADGKLHLPTYTGTLPSGVTAKFVVGNEEKTNGVQAVGTYEGKLVFEGKNHNTLEIPVTYKIKLDAIQLATTVINAFGSTPDPWTFLPDSFDPSYHTVASVPDYTAFTNSTVIPTNGIGKQMNVAYGLLNKTSKALSYVNTIMSSLNSIKSLYTSFLDDNPSDYQSFTGAVGGFTFTLCLTEDSYLLRATFGTVLVEIFSNTEADAYGATVKLTETTVLKYTVENDELTIAMDILDNASVQISFARNNSGHTVGMLYEYLTANDKTIAATSAMIEVGDDYTIVIGTKGDFIPTSVSRNCEIYDNETGKLVGSEVREDVKKIVFNTYWFPISNLDGVDTIMKIDKMNGDNADTIYINGISDDTLHTKLMGLSYGSKALSRRYDIEFKTVYGYVYNADTEEYEAVSYEIPMIFVQEEVISTFEEDFEEKNANTLGANGVSLLIDVNDYAAINYGYEVMLPLYDALKDAVTHEMICNYCKQE